MWCRVLLCVQRNSLLRLGLGMTDDTGPLQYASHSWILGRVSFNCISQCTTDSFVSRSQACGPRRVAFQQAFHSPPTCAVSILSLTTSQVLAPRATFTETPSKSALRRLVLVTSFLHQHFSRVSGHHRGSVHSNLNVERTVTAIWRPWNGSHFRVFRPRRISRTQGFS